METGIVVTVGILLIAVSSGVSTKVRVAPQLLLLGAGIIISFLPGIPHIEVDPELILELILPPLLYGSAVSIPAMDFRREFRSISGLAVVLVVASSLILGWLFTLLIPGLSYGWGVALGAIISPTDAVATSIVKNSNLSSRVVAILEGESLLNDASSLVVLRTAIASTAVAVSFWGAVGTFAYSGGVALAIGLFVGWAGLHISVWFKYPAVNAVLSLAWPFVAAIPASLLDASGLVAAVAAGLVRGYLGPRMLGPLDRRSSAETWETLTLLLEGAVFLIMGLELAGLLDHVKTAHESIWWAVTIALVGLVAALVLRALGMLPLLAFVRRANRRREVMQPRIEHMTQLDKDELIDRLRERGGFVARHSEHYAERFASRIRRASADIRYFVDEPLGWREVGVVTWAGMRGVVTLAAAQTLPSDAPYRSLLVLVAFVVAGVSLVVQGGLLRPVLRLIKPAKQDIDALSDQWSELLALLNDVREGLQRDFPDDMDQQDREIAILEAQRSALLDARDDGLYSAQVLQRALANLDVDQIAIELRSEVS